MVSIQSEQTQRALRDSYRSTVVSQVTVQRQEPAFGPIARAAAELQEALKLQRLQKVPGQRISRAITSVDSMLGILEYFNLKGVVPVPGSIVSAVSVLLESMPAQCEVKISNANSIEESMDELFSVQRRLLEMRSGPRWGRFDEETSHDIDQEEISPNRIDPARIAL